MALVALGWPAVAVATVGALMVGVGPVPPTATPARPGDPLASIPATAMDLYGRAAAICPGLPWEILAAIATVESDAGRSDLPGVRSGRNPAGAEGLMQFEPATFAEYSRPVPPGGADPPSPYDMVDSVYAASRLLCANGGGNPARIGGAVYVYNHSASYVAQVLSLAGRLGLAARAATTAGTAAVDWALEQVGTPYRWGGEQPGVGFDCSGLAQAAWAAAGVRLPRVAQDQFDAGPRLAPGSQLQPGDLVFFGPGRGVATHVGLVVDPAGVMVDAPHAGAFVRVEPFRAVPGAPWGSDIYLGATAPTGHLG